MFSEARLRLVKKLKKATSTKNLTWNGKKSALLLLSVELMLPVSQRKVVGFGDWWCLIDLKIRMDLHCEWDRI